MGISSLVPCYDRAVSPNPGTDMNYCEPILIAAQSAVLYRAGISHPLAIG